MFSKLSMLLTIIVLMPLIACSGDDNQPYTPPVFDGDLPDVDGDLDSTEDETEVEDADGDEIVADGDQESAEYNPDDPGYSIFFSVIYTQMMGQSIEAAMGGFSEARREEFNDDGGDDGYVIPIDTCIFGEGGGEELQDECQSDRDCAEEQRCLENEDSGQMRCVTETELLDVGPISVSGFSGGALTFAYNANQSGAYTLDGQGDGQLPEGAIAFESTYEISGEGSAEMGLTNIHGSFESPALIELTSPPTTTNSMGMPAISIDTSKDLTIAWNGSGDPLNEFKVTLTSVNDAGESTTIICRLSDDGEHTIDKSMMKAITFSTNPLYAMASMIMFESTVFGSYSADGAVKGEATFAMLNTLFMQAAAAK